MSKLRRDVLYNLAGLGAGPAVALLAIPLLLVRLGAERFGVLSLAWTFTAVSGIFDLGVGRAATLLIARHSGAGRLDEVEATKVAARRISVFAGYGMAALYLVAVFAGATERLRVDVGLASEVFDASILLAGVIPFQVGIASYRGMSEAELRFKETGLVRALLGASNFGVPLALAFFSTDLRLHTASIVLTRAAGFLAFRKLAAGGRGAKNGVPSASNYREILDACGWFTLDTVINPILVYADRFLIASMISAAAVPTYSVPAEPVLQLLIVASAATGVAFPNLSARAEAEPEGAWRLLWKMIGLNSLGSAAFLAAVALAVPYVIPLWVPSISQDGIRIAQILCLGVWFNGNGAFLLTYNHANKKYRTVALLHCAEMVLYVPVLIFCLRTMGVVGAAVAWVIRIGVDMMLLGGLALSIRRANAT